MKLSIASALVALAIAGPALAQTSVPPQITLPPDPAQAAVASGDAEWALRVGPRLVAALGSPSPSARAEALHAVGTLAYATSEGADLRPAVPALLHVLQTDPDWRHRVMALRSLEATADGDVMSDLWAEAGRQTHPAVQRTLLAVLAEHYGVNVLRQDPQMVALAQSLRDGRGLIAAR